MARTVGDFYAKAPEFGGKKGLVSYEPCINLLKDDEKLDFILMGCDWIFDRLENYKIFKKILEYKKRIRLSKIFIIFVGKLLML